MLALIPCTNAPRQDQRAADSWARTKQDKRKIAALRECKQGWDLLHAANTTGEGEEAGFEETTEAEEAEEQSFGEVCGGGAGHG